MTMEVEKPEETKFQLDPTANKQKRREAYEKMYYMEPMRDVCCRRCPENFVECLSRVIERLCQDYETRNAGKVPPEHVTSFHVEHPPKLVFPEYVNRLKRYFVCSNECYVICFVFMDRVVSILDQQTSSAVRVRVSRHTCHRLFLACLVLACKYYDDSYFANEYYARVGGVGLNEMNRLECDLLLFLDWECYVPPEEYERYLTVVMQAGV